MADDDDGELLTREQLGLPPAAATAPADQPAAATAPGAEGRQVIVRPRAPPKPPPAPIAPHEAAPVTVQPKVAAPAAEGQEPPAAPEEEQPLTREQLGIRKYPGLLADVGKSAWSGLAEGTEGLLGLPGDLPRLADYGLDWAGAHINQWTGGENAQHAIERTHGSLLRQVMSDKAYNEFMPPGAAQFQTWAKQIGIPGVDYKPQSIGGRYAHEIAAFAPGALATIPFGGAGMAAKILPRLGETIAPAVGSETLGHMTEGTSLEPWARLAGAGLGGVGQIKAGQTASAAREWAAPAFKGNAEDLAAAQLRAGSQDPDAALAKVRAAQAQRQPGMATGENIPGSKPTLGQVTGDLGQLDLERQASVLDPAGHAARMTAQRAAQSKALEGVASGAPQTVADMITQRLRDIDAQHEAAVASQRGVAERAHAVKGQRLETEAKQLGEQARTSAGQIARKGEPEVLGERARAALADSMAQAKEKERRLWQAIGADKIGVMPHQIGGQARKLQRQIGRMQKPMEGDEARIFGNASQLGKNWTKLSDVTDLTSDLKTAMRQERIANGNTPALKRMTQLLKTAEKVITNAATRQSAKEAEAEMGKLRAMTPEDRARIMAARAVTRARGDIERGPAGAIIRPGATSGSYRTDVSQVPGKVFAKGPTGYQKLKAYAEAVGKPWLDPVHDIVSDSLAREAATDGVIDSKKLAKWQNDHQDALRALPDEVRQKFVGGESEAAAALAEGAAARREALNAHSKLEVGKEFDKRLAQGSPEAAAMRSHPAFRGLEGADNPRDVQKRIGNIVDGQDPVATMQRLAREVSGNQKAAEGLQRAVLDHVIEKVSSQAEAGTEGVQALKPGMTQSYITKNRPTFKAAGFTDQQINILDRTVADVKRQQRFSATKYPGQSNTAQDVFRLLKESNEQPHNFGVWGKLFAAREGWELVNKVAEHVHEWTGVPKGVTKVAALPAVIGFNKLNHARQAGLKNVADLVHEAVMNPDQGAALLSRTPKIPGRGSQATLGQSWRRHAMYAGLAAERPEALGHDVYVRKGAQ